MVIGARRGLGACEFEVLLAPDDGQRVGWFMNEPWACLRDGLAMVCPKPARVARAAPVGSGELTPTRARRPPLASAPSPCALALV